MSLIPASYIEKSWRKALDSLEFGTLTFTAPNGEVTVARGRAGRTASHASASTTGMCCAGSWRAAISGWARNISPASWDTDNVEKLISLFLLNLDHFSDFSHGNFLNRLGFVIHNALVRRNSIAGSSRNIKDHYDVGNEFYSLWLDRSMTYSSALYAGACDLYRAQQNKYERILSKFEKPRSSVLEIGCGWGGFAERAAADNHQVTGLTISPSQHKFATERLKGAADIRLEDYRRCKGQFDNIVSIEMFEAVGEHYWPHYFATVAERLKRGGRAIIQTITIKDELFAGYRTRSDFVRHYVFPGGMLPSLARFREEAERAGLKFAGAFGFGKDYARTLREWLVRDAGPGKRDQGAGP